MIDELWGKGTGVGGSAMRLVWVWVWVVVMVGWVGCWLACWIAGWLAGQHFALVAGGLVRTGCVMLEYFCVAQVVVAFTLWVEVTGRR